MNTDLFQNCTPHDITIRIDGVDHTIPKSGKIARVTHKEYVTEGMFGITLVSRVVFGIELPPREWLDLPDGAKPRGKFMIVSTMVMEALGDACPDYVMVPDSGPTAIRNDKGQVVAVTRLVHATKSHKRYAVAYASGADLFGIEIDPITFNTKEEANAHGQKKMAGTFGIYCVKEIK